MTLEHSIKQPIISLVDRAPLFSFDLTGRWSETGHCGQQGKSLYINEPTKCSFHKKLLARDLCDSHWFIYQTHFNWHLVIAGC